MYESLRRENNNCHIVVDEIEKRTKVNALVVERQFAESDTFTVSDRDIQYCKLKYTLVS